MKKSVLFILVISVSLALSSCTINSSSFTDEEHQAVVDEKASLQSEYDSLNSQYSALQSEYNSYKNDTADWAEYSEAEKETALEVAEREDDIAALDAEISTKNDTIASLQSEIDGLNNQIASLRADVVEAQGDPISFPAGYFTAGTDFAVGRYKIYDGTSNFFVHDLSGDSRVNIILDSIDDGFYVKEYVYAFRAGDEIRAESTFKMVPIS